MNISEMTQWRCKNGHVLGIIERVKNGERRKTRLLLFRNALDLNSGTGVIDVMANIDGTTLDVRCSVPGCGAMRSWFAGEAALERLIDQAISNRVALDELAGG